MKPATDEEIFDMIQSLQMDKIIINKRINYLESVLSEIQMLNYLGKNLKIAEAIQAAIQE
jgi:hypothetical protein